MKKLSYLWNYQNGYNISSGLSLQHVWTILYNITIGYIKGIVFIQISQIKISNVYDVFEYNKRIFGYIIGYIQLYIYIYIYDINFNIAKKMDGSWTDILVPWCSTAPWLASTTLKDIPKPYRQNCVFLVKIGLGRFGIPPVITYLL